MHRSVSIFSFVFAWTLGSCIKGTPTDSRPMAHTVSFTMNGGLYSNESYTLATPLYPSSGATYDTTLRVTWCNVYGAPSNVPYSVNIWFPGAQQGTFAWTYALPLESYISIQLAYGQQSRLSSTTNGSTTVTSYGNTGEQVVGTFSGFFLERSVYDTVAINGSFSITRIK